jgi:hypothetical protein
MDGGDLVTLFANFGLAGLVVFIFYSLMTKELNNLRQSIDRLRETVERLIFIVDRESKRRE